jgi:hypothetical protein
VRGVLWAVALVALASGCAFGARKPDAPATAPPLFADVLPDVRQAKDRPPVVLVTRDGDPMGAISAAVVVAAIDAEPAVALAGVIESRLAARSLEAIVTPSWDGVRATVLFDGEGGAKAATDALREALSLPIEERDLAPAKKKLAALALRPLHDAKLARWAKCVGSPYAAPERAGKTHDDLALAKLEEWRAASHGLGRTAFAIAGSAAMGEEVAAAIAKGPPWKKAAELLPSAPVSSSVAVEVFAAPGETVPVAHATLDVGSSSAAVATAEALGDPRGPLATRLSGLELPFRLKEVTGIAHARGGCVGLVLEAASGAPANDVAARVADAIALVHVEAEVVLAEPSGSLRDGRTLARRSGDARDAAERAAWWALAKPEVPSATSERAPRSSSGSVVLAMPGKRNASPKEKETVEPSRETVSAALERASSAWSKPVAEGRVRVEPGQGEVWVLVASPCGTDAETDADSGLTSLVVAAAAEGARSSPDARVEPWMTADGAGLLVHGAPLRGETPAAQARRLADVAARSFAAEPITPTALSRARGALLHANAAGGGPSFALLATALSPSHPSWVVPSGKDEVLARSSDAAVIARAQALRAGPLRVAILANVDAAQGEAAQRAVDRWIDRRGSDTRTCKIGAAASPPKPGTFSAETRGGAAPEAYLAFPFPAGDEIARASAMIVAAALEGDAASSRTSGLLDKALGGDAQLARLWSARVLGWPRAPALVVRIVSTQAQLDDAVMQTRALLDRLRQGGGPQADLDRARANAARASIVTALDPRARIVATWRGEPVPPTAPRVQASHEAVRAFAQKHHVEDSMIVVAARPARR